MRLIHLKPLPHPLRENCCSTPSRFREAMGAFEPAAQTQDDTIQSELELKLGLVDQAANAVLKAQGQDKWDKLALLQKQVAEILLLGGVQ